MVSCNKINVYANSNNNICKPYFKSSNNVNQKNSQADNFKIEKERTKIEILDDFSGILLIVSLVANQKNIDLSKKLTKMQWVSVGALALCCVTYAASIIKKFNLNKNYNKEFNA